MYGNASMSTPALAAASAAVPDLVMMSFIDVLGSVCRIFLHITRGEVAGEGGCPGFPQAEVNLDVYVLLGEYAVEGFGIFVDAAAVLEDELFADVYFHLPRVNMCAGVARSCGNSPPIGVGAKERALDEIR